MAFCFGNWKCQDFICKNFTVLVNDIFKWVYEANNICVILDNKLNFDHQCSNIYRNPILELKRIYILKDPLDEQLQIATN